LRQRLKFRLLESLSMKLTHALIFAAGRGERMLPLTTDTPKPLLSVGGKPLIVWHLEKIARLGISHVVINTSYLAEQFPKMLGDGSRWGVAIHYCYEGSEPLETGGGMLNALPFLSETPFLCVNGDIWTEMDFCNLCIDTESLAHLIMVDNPPHNSRGDFVLREGKLWDEPSPRLTFSGMGIYRPALLSPCSPAKFSLAPLLRAAMREGKVSGQHYRGAWHDVGTPERLIALDSELKTRLQLSDF